MHASSLENMQKAYDRYVKEFISKSNKTNINLIDIGGANVNGSYADIFSIPQINYKAVDIYPGEGIDVVLKDPYVLPFDNDEIDIIISGQAFEHVEFFWDLFVEMSRVLSKDGLLILIAPSSGPIHRYPVDCYRFHPDAYTSLAKYAKINLIDVWMDNKGPWNDLVGVFTKQTIKKYNCKENNIFHDIEPNRYEQILVQSNVLQKSVEPEAEIMQGEINYLKVLNKLHTDINPKLYLEVGVREGDSLQLSNAKSIAIDPSPSINFELNENHNLYKITSDDFFEFYAKDILKEKIDLAFIDGMHLFEFALRDFMNIEKYSKPNGIIVVDDIYPNHFIQAKRKRSSLVWTGDIWKLQACLEKYRPDLKVIALNTFPAGTLIVGNLNPNDKVLEKNYNEIVAEFKDIELSSNNNRIIARQGAQQPTSKYLWAVIKKLTGIVE